MNTDYLTGHLFYVLCHEDYKQRRRGLKYLGQEPIYILIKNTQSRTLNRVPEIFTKSFVDKLQLYCYTGLYDMGAKKVPMFKLKLEEVDYEQT